jgi:DNA-binding NtrC family response regulator
MESPIRSKRKILIVEDDEAIRDVYHALFFDKFVDHEILLAESITRAKELVFLNSIKSIDVAILDGQLPDGRAWDVVDELIPNGFLGGIIVITGGFNVPIPDNFIGLIDVIFRKPVPFAPLLSMMCHCIENTEQRLKDKIPS